MFSVLLVACRTARTSSGGAHTATGGTHTATRGTHTATGVRHTSREAAQTGGASIAEKSYRVGEEGSHSYGWTASDGTLRKETGMKNGEGDFVSTQNGVNRDTRFWFKG